MQTIFNWKFWQQAPAVAPLPEQMRRTLVTERNVSAKAAASLRMIEQTGNYSGRKVTYFRVFDPEDAQRAGFEVRHYGDLDDHKPLQLHTGHVETGADGTVRGQIVLYRQQASPSGNVV